MNDKESQTKKQITIRLSKGEGFWTNRETPLRGFPIKCSR